MRKSQVELVESVRALKLVRSEGAHGVRIALPPQELPQRLLRVLESLEAADRDAGSSAEEDLAKLRTGLEGVFRWIRMQGLGTDEPLDIVAKALSGKPLKKQKSLVPMPKFAPKYKPKKAWKPKLGIDRKFEDSKHMETMEDHVERGRAMDEVLSKMGAAAPTSHPREETETSLGMGPC